MQKKTKKTDTVQHIGSWILKSKEIFQNLIEKVKSSENIKEKMKMRENAKKKYTTKSQGRKTGLKRWERKKV